MAIAVDSTQGGNGGLSVSNTTWTHTCNGTDVILFVAVQVSGDAFPNRVNSVTYNGVGLTRRSEILQGNSSGTVSFWYLINPPTGSAYTISVSTVVVVPVLAACSASYNGAKQTGFPDNAADTDVTFQTSFSQGIISVANGCWHIAGCLTPGPTTAGAGTVRRISNLDASSLNQLGNICIMDNNGPITPAANNVINVNIQSPFTAGNDSLIGVTMAPTFFSVDNGGFMFSD